VQAIEAATTKFKCQDFAQGSGMAWDTAVARLRVTLPLLGAQMAPEVRPRLYLAIAHLALQVGYMSFDVNHHDDARRLWMIGLDIARHTEDPAAATSPRTCLMTWRCCTTANLGGGWRSLTIRIFDTLGEAQRQPLGDCCPDVLALCKFGSCIIADEPWSRGMGVHRPVRQGADIALPGYCWSGAVRCSSSLSSRSGARKPRWCALPSTRPHHIRAPAAAG
jgi:hypothetical protein